MKTDAMKIGLIAGAGDLPYHVIQGAQESGHSVFVSILGDAATPSDFTVPAKNFPIAALGKVIKAFKREKCTHICFAGHVERPDFGALKPDLKAMKYLPGALSAARKGDDALLSYMVDVFEKEGFPVIAPQTLCQSLLLPEGFLGSVTLADAMRDDCEKACEIAAQIGALDIGQGAVVCGGLVLAIEAQEGTDAMLERVASLPEAIRGTQEARSGIFAKMIKPGQETRIDLPTIGLETVRRASEAGLAGIVAESGGAFILDRDAVINLANTAGLFIMGLPPSKTSSQSLRPDGAAAGSEEGSMDKPTSP